MYCYQFILTLLASLTFKISFGITPLDQHCVVTTHNAFTYDDFLPNQLYDMPRQLTDGVKGFMLDNYDKDGEIKLCHGDFMGCYPDTFIEVMNDIFIPHLQQNADSIITIIIEDYVESRDLWESSLQQVTDIDRYAFNPFDSEWDRLSSHWPSVEDLVTNNQRLFIFTSKSSNSGYFSVNGGTDNLYIMYQWDWTVENYWSLGQTIGEHDYSCYGRGESEPLDAETIKEDGFNWLPLFVMNHFHGVPEMWHSGIDNKDTNLVRRFLNYCYPESKKLPNYLAVDFYNMGDPFQFVGLINDGGFIFYEGNGATQDIVCEIDGSWSHGVNMQNNNVCENDEARSVWISDVKKGTRLTVYDSPSQSREDDFCEIYIKQDIGNYYETEGYKVSSFEESYEDAYVLVSYYKNNGLDGKISYVEIIQAGDGSYFDDAAIVFYEGNGATQNIVCTLPLTHDLSVNFKDDNFGCDNDETRSLKITKAIQGSKITIYDDPDGKTDDDFYIIDVLQDILTPIIVPSYESNINNEYIKGTYYRDNGLDGKVSNVRIQVP